MRLGVTRQSGPGMGLVLCGLFLIHHNAAFAAAAPNRQTDLVETSQGALKITPLFHGSVMLDFGGKIIHIDPWSQADYAGIPQADLILITHTHADHMDPAMIKMLKKESTVIVTPPAVADTLNGAAGVIETISNGEKQTYLGIEIEAFPMYNLKLGPAPGKPFHHKGRLRTAFWRDAGVLLGRHRVCPRDEGAAQHLGGFSGHEPAQNDAAGRGRRLREGVPSEDCLPVSLPRPEHAGVRRRSEEYRH
jgi:hypothetical protein